MCGRGQRGRSADGCDRQDVSLVSWDWEIGRRRETERSYVPNKRQALEVQKGEDESKEFPDASLANEAELAAQSGQGRRHC